MTEVKVNYDLLLNKQIEIQLKSRSSVGGEMESTDTQLSSFLF